MSGAPAVVAVVRAPFLARDGHHLVYRGTDSRLWVRRTASGEEREIVLADDVSIYGGSVDRGRLVAFSSRARDNYQEYFTVDLETCSSRDLGIRVSTADVTIGYSVMAALSVSGDQLFYAISRGKLQAGSEYLLDVPTLAKRTAPTQPHEVYAAVVDQERAVWLERARDGAVSIAAWTLADDAVRTRPMPTDASPVALAASAGRAVWTDRRDITGGVHPPLYVQKEHAFLLDLARDEERRVSPEDTRQTDPSVLGHLVAWADDRTGRFAIRVLDLDTGEERQVASSASADLRWPTLTEAGLFWVEPDRDRSLVYLDPTIKP